jgi:hypothetical protein
MTLICGTWNVWHFLAVIRAGGVGKNGSTVAVSLKLQISISNSKTIFFLGIPISIVSCKNVISQHTTL